MSLKHDVMMTTAMYIVHSCDRVLIAIVNGVNETFLRENVLLVMVKLA